MKWLAICATTVLLAACGGATASSGKIRPARSGSPAAVASAPSDSQPAIGSAVSASAAALTSASPAASASGCRLAVVTWTQTAQGQVPSPGFLTYPGEQLSAAQDAGFVQEGTRYRSTAKPYLYGAGGPGPGSYDWQLKRWLPAQRQTISPDGSHYAYQSDFGAIHIVDVATGIDRTFAAPQGPDTLLYYAKEGVYFNHASLGPAGPGLWLLDPISGAIQTVFSDRPVDSVGGFAAWLPDVNPADPHPVLSQFSQTKMANQILRRDLNGGPTAAWFYRAGRSLTVVGFDQSKHPLILTESLGSPDTSEVWQVPAANQGNRLYSGVQVPQMLADSHGIWFSDQRGISLYTPANGIQKLSSVVADLAGPCQ